MNDLDLRAQAAAEGLRRSVDSADLKLASQVLGEPIPLFRRPLFAFAGGVAAAAAVLAVLFVGPFDPTTEDVVTAPTTVVTSVVEVTPTSVDPVEESEGTVNPPVDETMPAPASTSSSTSTSTTVADSEPPVLEITDPIDGFESEEARIEFRGITEPGARVYAGRYEAAVDEGGGWSIVLLLAPGENRARFVAVDGAGNETEAWVTVALVIPETTTTKPPEETTTTKADEEIGQAIEFKVYATYYESSATPPFEVYYGTGSPGTVVEFVSAYGTGRAEIGQDGTFETKVVFSEVPLGESFMVVVESSEGHRLEFPFKRIEG